MTDANQITEADISPKAVELAAVGAENNGQRWLAEMLRELSRSLTASGCEKEKLRAFVRRIAGTYTLDREELIRQIEDAKKLLEEVP